LLDSSRSGIQANVSDEIPGWIDLTAAADAFKGETRYRPLIDAIRRYTAYESAKTDLQYAQQRLKIAGELAGPQPAKQSSISENEDTASIISALLVHALILYTRATKTSSNHRAQVPFTRRWNRHLKDTHERVTNLRDDVIAHFGPGDRQPAGYWAKERVIARKMGDKLAIGSPKLRAHFRGAVFDDLNVVIDAALRAAEEIENERARNLSSQLDACADADPDFRSKIAAFRFDEEGYFEDAERVESFREFEKIAGTTSSKRYSVDISPKRT
jgi:hypothetical protein